MHEVRCRCTVSQLSITYLVCVGWGGRRPTINPAKNMEKILCGLLRSIPGDLMRGYTKYVSCCLEDVCGRYKSHDARVEVNLLKEAQLLLTLLL